MPTYVASTTDTVVSGFVDAFNTMVTYVTDELLLEIAGVAILILVVTLVKRLFWSPFRR
jgi:hypothetical protein